MSWAFGDMRLNDIAALGSLELEVCMKLLSCHRSERGLI